MLRRPALAILLCAALAAPLGAQTPQPEQMTFQGRLTDAAGNPVTADVSLVFAIYDADTGGTPLWTETQSVAVSGGLYTVWLGTVSSLNGLTMDMASARWLGIRAGVDPEMTPRYPLTGVPYARRALVAEGAVSADYLDGQHASAFAQSVHTHDAAAIASGLLPAARGGTGVTGSGGVSHFLRGTGAGGWTSGPILAGDLPSAGAPYILRNAADASTADVAGWMLSIENASKDPGAGVLLCMAASSAAGEGSFTGITGVSGKGDNTDDTVGVTNTGVSGLATGYSRAAGAETSNYGLLGTANGTSALGATTNCGAAGFAQGGGNAKNYGLWGEATTATAGDNHGVYGTAANGATNWAGYFEGDVNITGSVTLGNEARDLVTVRGTLQDTSPLVFEGAVDAYELTLSIPPLLADRVITLPDATGTVITTGNLSQITAVGTITSGTWAGSAIGVGSGGTGALAVGSAGAVAFSTGSAYGFTGVGSSGQVLISGGGVTTPTWGDANAHAHAASAINSGTLPVARGGTNATAVGSAGSVNYSTGTAHAYSATGVSGQILHSGGTGVPTWGAVNLASPTETTGTLQTGNGGTGLSGSGPEGNYLRSNGTAWTVSAIQAADIPSGSGYYLAKNLNANITSTASIAGNLYALTNNSGSSTGACALRANAGASVSSAGTFCGLVGESGVNDVWISGPSPAVFNYGVQGIASGAADGSSETTTINYGVYGDASAGDTNYGVYGSATGGAANYAGYFAGNVTVLGAVSKLSGSFKIDHPLDPANKTLSHSFVESPDMKNVYDGVAVLDAKGEAWVAMPEWLETLNRDFRYQLTCLGGFAPVYVAEKVSGNRFKIAGGRPGLEVSWQVTGIRQDPFAVKHPIVVEEVKAPHDRGKYLAPDAYGLPPEMGIGCLPAPAGRR